VIAGTRCLVTGGAGVVGSHIVDELVKAGAEDVVVLDALSRGRPENLAWALDNGPVRLMQGDIADAAVVAEAVEARDLVFHQAALRITQCAEDPRAAHRVMVDGTFNVVEAAARASVRKLVYASSASVYGRSDAPFIAEDHSCTDATMYSAAKMYGESLLRTFRETTGLPFAVLRYFNVYGPRMSIDGPYTEVLVRWIERIESGQPPLILGDGQQAMDFVYVGDVARANLAAAVADVEGAVINVGTGRATTLFELASAVLRVMGSDLRPEHAPARDVNSVARRVADVSRAKRLLRFRAETTLEEGLGRLVAWWRDARAPVAGPAGGSPAPIASELR